MRIFADRRNRRMFLTVAAVLIIYAILIQLFCKGFSLPVLFLSVVSSFAVLMLFVLFFRKQDRSAIKRVRLKWQIKQETWVALKKSLAVDLRIKQIRKIKFQFL